MVFLQFIPLPTPEVMQDPSHSQIIAWFLVIVTAVLVFLYLNKISIVRTLKKDKQQREEGAYSDMTTTMKSLQVQLTESEKVKEQQYNYLINANAILRLHIIHIENFLNKEDDFDAIPWVTAHEKKH